MLRAVETESMLQDFAEPDDTPVVELSGEQRRRNGRFLWLACGVGGLIIAVIASVSVVVVSHYLDDTSSLDATMSTRYQRQYRSCVEQGGSQADCAQAAQRSCVGDPGWLDQGRSDEALVAEISSVCRFGPDRLS